MEKRGKEFQKKLLSTFKVEAAEHIQALSSGLIGLESAPPGDERMQIIEAAFREAHSLKGAARAVGLAEIESICQSTESVFAALKRNALELSPALFDVLHDALDVLGKLLPIPEQPSGKAEVPIAELLRRLEGALQGKAQPRQEFRAPPVEDKTVLADTVRLATAKLDALLFQAEELLAAKQAGAQRVADLREALAELARLKKEGARVAPAIKSLEARLRALAKSAEQDQRSLGAMVDALLENMKKALMLPISTALELLPKMVRDLSREQGKEVELALSGGETEVDRRILEEMRDPLIHLTRNSIDHGIEMPEARRRAHKSPRGTVTLAVTQKDGSKIEILVSDDGAGIDVAKVREAARKLGVISPEAAEDREHEGLLPLVFQSGLSTSPIITDLSGRGLGLAIVREKVDRLGGAVSVETQPGRGTAFRVVLPVTLATFRGVHVRVNDHRFVVPSAQVEQALRLKREEIKTVENRETIRWQGQAMALVWLADVLELPRKHAAGSADDRLHAVILGAVDKRIAFGVDEIVGEHEVLVKTLGKQLSRVRNLAGATVLGTGKAVPILNVADLLRSAVKVAAAPVARTTEKEDVAAERKSILVAEDSITARALLKNILESAGYHVAAAVDGIDAFTLLKTERFDLVVSDVEMPRMDGFDLTAKIRADRTLAEMPVVLVTALESREHRERGVDAGANAYIVKSSFDQSNLLDIVRRLL